MKTKLSVIGFLIILLATIFLFHPNFQRPHANDEIIRLTTENKEDSVVYSSPIDPGIKGTLEITNVRKILLSTADISSNDLDVTDPEIPLLLLDRRDGSLIIFAHLNGLSGTGGERIEIISNKGKLVYDFFGSQFVLLDSFRIQGRTISFNELSDAGACCSMSEDVWIDLDEPYHIIKPGFPDSLAAYVQRHKLSLNPQELSDSVTQYRREDDNTILVDRKPYTSIDDSLPLETWRYDLRTKTYTQIN